MHTKVGDACPGVGLVLQGVLLSQLPEQGVRVQECNVPDLQYPLVSADMRVVLAQSASLQWLPFPVASS